MQCFTGEPSSPVPIENQLERVPIRLAAGQQLSPTSVAFSMASSSSVPRNGSDGPRDLTPVHQHDNLDLHHYPQQKQRGQNKQHYSSAPSSAHAAAPAARLRRNDAPAERCVTCRLRKVKCSGRLGDGEPCARCLSGNYDCSFTVPKEGRISRVAPTKDRTEAGTTRKRAQKACQQCHLHKTKCSGGSPRCTRCEKYNMNCEYISPKTRSPRATGTQLSMPQEDRQEPNRKINTVVAKDGTLLLASSPVSSSSADTNCSFNWTSIKSLYSEQFLVGRDTLFRHFEVFFKTWDCIPCMGFMEKATTDVEIEEERLHPGVAAAVCAMTSHLVHPGETQIPLANRCAEQVELYIFGTIDSITCNSAPPTLTALICAICHFWHENQLAKVWIYVAIAARLITRLELNGDGFGQSCVEQETNRRLVSACYILDRLLASGFDEHIVLPDSYIHFQLPVGDKVLHESIRTTEDIRNIDRPYALAITNTLTKRSCLDEYHLKLHHLRHEILGFVRKLTGLATSTQCGPQFQASQLIQTVNKLQNELINIKLTLPEYLRLNDTNINMLVNSRDGPSFIMFHSLLWILHTDLYGFTIPDMPEGVNQHLLRQLPTEFIIKSRRQALGYSVSLARLWRQLQGIVAKRPPGDGTERLLTVDQMFATYVIRPTKMLLAARKHRLYDLRDSTAPLLRQEPVNDDTLAGLVLSNMQLFPPLAHFFPHILKKIEGLREAVERFGQNDSDMSNGSRVE